MSLMDTAGNIITLGVSYKITKDLLGNTRRKKRRCRKRKR